MKTRILWIFRVVALLLVALSLSGCVNLAKVVEQLKDDPATVGANITTVYGSFRFVRTGLQPTNATTTVSPDGTLVIKSN